MCWKIGLRVGAEQTMGSSSNVSCVGSMKKMAATATIIHCVSNTTVNPASQLTAASCKSYLHLREDPETECSPSSSRQGGQYRECPWQKSANLAAAANDVSLYSSSYTTIALN